MDCSLPGSSVHGIFQARVLEWGAIAYSSGSSQSRNQNCVSCISCIGRWILYLQAYVCSCAVFNLSVVSDSFATPLTAALQAPLSMGFPRQEYRSGLPFPSPRALLTQGLNPDLLHLLHWQVNPLPLRHLGSPSLKNSSRFSEKT